jgi:hypothetical protein
MHPAIQVFFWLWLLVFTWVRGLMTHSSILAGIVAAFVAGIATALAALVA